MRSVAYVFVYVLCATLHAMASCVRTFTWKCNICFLRVICMLSRGFLKIDHVLQNLERHKWRNRARVRAGGFLKYCDSASLWFECWNIWFRSIFSENLLILRYILSKNGEKHLCVCVCLCMFVCVCVCDVFELSLFWQGCAKCVLDNHLAVELCFRRRTERERVSPVAGWVLWSHDQFSKCLCLYTCSLYQYVVYSTCVCGCVYCLRTSRPSVSRV